MTKESHGKAHHIRDDRWLPVAKRTGKGAIRAPCSAAVGHKSCVGDEVVTVEWSGAQERRRRRQEAMRKQGVVRKHNGNGRESSFRGQLKRIEREAEKDAHRGERQRETAHRTA